MTSVPEKKLVNEIEKFGIKMLQFKKKEYKCLKNNLLTFLSGPKAGLEIL